MDMLHIMLNCDVEDVPDFSSRDIYIYIYINGARDLSGGMRDWQSREPAFDSSSRYRFEVWAFLFSPRRPSSLSCINEYQAKYSAGNVSE